jgi:hypothetical protein
MLENGEIAEELLTVSGIAAALKVPVTWVYQRTGWSGRGQERCAMPHPRDILRRECDENLKRKAYGLERKHGLDRAWTEKRAVLAHGWLQRRPFI